MQWQTRLLELQEFHQTYGHCRVPFKYPPNSSLGRWVSTMRQEFKKRENGKQSSMTAERIADLNSLGFEWVGGVKSKATEKAKKKKIRPASSIAAKRRSKRKLAGSKTTGLSDEEEEPIIKIDPPCQSSTESTSSQHHHLNNNKHGPNKASMCYNRSHREQCHQQHHYGQKEVTPAVPRRIAEEGGFAFVEGLEETSRNMSEELERRKDQPTPQIQHQPQHPPPNMFYHIHISNTSRNSTTDLI